MTDRLALDDLLALAPKKQIKKHFNFVPECNLLYVSVPKVACTTLRATFQRLALAKRGQPYSMEKPKNVHKSELLRLQSSHGRTFEETLENINDGSWTKIAFVRNPYRRVLSSYLNKVVSQKKGRRRPASEGIAKSLGISPKEEISFGEFVARVAEQDPRTMNSHWRPQVRLLLLPYVQYDFIGRLETFDADMEKVREIVKTDLSPYFVAHVGAATGAFKVMADYFTDDIKAQVDKIYAEDFDLLDYPRELRIKRAA